MAPSAFGVMGVFIALCSPDVGRVKNSFRSGSRRGCRPATTTRLALAADTLRKTEPAGFCACLNEAAMLGLGAPCAPFYHQQGHGGHLATSPAALALTIGVCLFFYHAHAEG